jgi:predicted RNA binding protein YcfA (HicA-like mRNA interferase family)
MLEAQGFVARKAVGSHQAYKRVTAAGSYTVIVPTHSREIARGTLRSIIKQSGFSEAEFLQLIDDAR